MKPLYLLLTLFIGLYVGMLLGEQRTTPAETPVVVPDFQLQKTQYSPFGATKYNFVTNEQPNGQPIGHVTTRRRLRHGEIYTIIIVVPE
jgi:hypothetical protein